MKQQPQASLESRIVELLNTTRTLSGVQSVRSDALKTDGSGRKYYRATLSPQLKLKTVVALNSPKGLGPKLSGNNDLTQEKAFVELCKYFESVSIPVPTFFATSPDNDLIITEDIGDLALYHLIDRDKIKDKASFEKLQDQYKADLLAHFFKQAILLIKQMQSLPVDPKFICFRRHLAFENYRTEIQEFSDFFLASRAAKKSEIEHLNKIYDNISEHIAAFPRTLSHFDFNAHNLFIDPKGRLRVLDFQDACMTSPARDIFSLINDRGMNELLGDSLHLSLYDFYKLTLQVPDTFDFTYSLTALHWDLRVAGRFIKLNQNLSTDYYSQWIPSTLRRLAKTMINIQKDFDQVHDILEISGRICPEMKEVLI